MNSLILAPIFFGSLGQRRMASLFSLFAIVLGVGLGVAVQAIHEAALHEFGRGVRTLAGAADLRLVGPASGFDDRLLSTLDGHPAIADASPVLEISAKVAGQDLTLPLLGVDVFSLARVAPRLLPQASESAGRFASLAPDNIFLSAAALQALNLAVGDQLALQSGTQRIDLTIAGLLPGVSEGQRLAVMDIAAAQLHFGQIGQLSRIDLTLRPETRQQALIDSLQASLPAGVVIEAPDAAADQSGNLTRAYRVNLSMLAAIALLTGAFLVFSAQALSVVKRRSEFAFLRALGLARASLIRWLLAEGAAVGLVGGLLGVALGYGLAWAALRLLGGDLGAGYFAGLQPTLEFKWGMTLLYVALGVLAGVAGAALPAREAADIAPAQALKAVGDALTTSGAQGRPTWGISALLLAFAACLLPPIGGLPLGGYGAIGLLLTGSVLLLPLAAHGLSLALARFSPTLAWRLAAARLSSAPGYAVVAAAGVLTSVALAVAMAIMVSSFRQSVDAWLLQLLPADIYVRAGYARSSAFIGPEMQAKIAAQPGIQTVQFTRHDQLRLMPGAEIGTKAGTAAAQLNAAAPVALIARPLSINGAELPLVSRLPTVDRQSVWISEAMADQHAWRVGDWVDIPLAGKVQRLQVGGIWRDYSRQTGAIMLDLAIYQAMTGDQRINDVAITLTSGASASEVAARIVALAGPGELESALPGEIRQLSLTIFDRTFAITYLLEAVAIVIGLAGVAASFASLAATRRKEFGMLRHLGVSRAQIGAMLGLEGAMVSATGVIGGLLAGSAIGLVLIEVVNRQSFHWSMDLAIPWLGLLIFALSMTLLAALSAVLAGRQAMRQDAVLAVREDW